jgi:hypothetical protein
MVTTTEAARRVVPVVPWVPAERVTWLAQCVKLVETGLVASKRAQPAASRLRNNLETRSTLTLVRFPDAVEVEVLRR